MTRLGGMDTFSTSNTDNTKVRQNEQTFPALFSFICRNYSVFQIYRTEFISGSNKGETRQNGVVGGVETKKRDTGTFNVLSYPTHSLLPSYHQVATSAAFSSCAAYAPPGRGGGVRLEAWIH